MGCTTDGVRILSAVLNSSVIAPLASAVGLSGDSFHAALESASTEIATASVSATQGTNPQHMAAPMQPKGDDPKAATPTVVEAKLAPSTAPRTAPSSAGGEVVDGVVGGKEAMIPPGAGVVSAVVTQGAGQVVVSSDVVAMVAAPSSEGYLRQGMTGASMSDESSSHVVIQATVVQPTGGGLVRVAGKQERTKPQTDMKAAEVQGPIPVEVAVVDPGKTPVVNLTGWQGLAHEQTRGPLHDSVSDATGGEAKHTAAVSSAGTSGKVATAAQGEGSGADAPTTKASAANGTEPVVDGLVSAELGVAGFDLSALAGQAGGGDPANSGDVGLAAGPSPGKVSAAVSDMGGLKMSAAGNSTAGNNLAGNSKAVSTTTGSSSNAAGSGVVELSSHGVGSGASIAQSAGGDPAKLLITPRAADGSAVPTPVQTIAHAAVSPEPVTTVAADAAHTAKSADVPAAMHMAGAEVGASSGVNSARVLQTMGETEMHVGMHSAEFGDISIRTSLSQQQMVTQISVAHNDLSQAISTHVSTVQTKLGEEYGLHASIEVNNQGSGLSGGQGDSSQREQQSLGSSNRGRNVVPAELHESSASVVALASAGSGHGLDVTV